MMAEMALMEWMVFQVRQDHRALPGRLELQGLRERLARLAQMERLEPLARLGSKDHLDSHGMAKTG